MEYRIFSPRDPDECTRPPGDAQAIFGKNLAAADMALEPTEGFGLNGPTSDKSRPSHTKSSPLAQARSAACRHSFDHEPDAEWRPIWFDGNASQVRHRARGVRCWQHLFAGSSQCVDDGRWVQRATVLARHAGRTYGARRDGR